MKAAFFDILNPTSGLEKLGFLVHESLCSSKQVQENVVCLIILCTLWLYVVMCLPHCVPCRAPNEICYGTMKQCNNILPFPHIKAERLSEKRTTNNTIVETFVVSVSFKDYQHERRKELQWITLKYPIRTRYFCYSKNANKINVHKCKNQNIPSGYLRAQSQQWKL